MFPKVVCVCIYIYFVYQVDVERVKECFGKTGKNALVWLAGSIEASQYWSGKMSEYLAKAACMISKGPEVSQTVQELRDLVFDPLPVQWLLLLVKKLPVLQQGLREGSCDELFSLTKKRIEEVWSWVKAQEADPALLKDCSALLAEATLLFPLDAGLQKDFYACGEAITKSAGETLIKDVIHSCMRLAEADSRDLEALQQLVDECDTTLSRIGENFSGAKDEATTAMQAGQSALMSFAGKAKWTEKSVQAVLASSCTVCTKIAKLMKSARQEKEVGFLEAGLALVRNIEAATCASDPDGANSQDEVLSRTVEMRRHLMIISQFVDDQALANHQCRPVILKYVKEGEAKLGGSDSFTGGAKQREGANEAGTVEAHCWWPGDRRKLA